MRQAIDSTALPDAPAAVLDTNAVLDWLVFHDPGVTALSQAIEAGLLRWLATPGMRRELQHMLGHASLERWEPDREHALTIFDRHAILTEIDLPPSVAAPRCSDPDDQVFIDLALAAGARWLVSHDRAVLRLARRLRVHGVEVVRPAAWAARQPQTAAP
jgi:predicted nucleic acid-binding protein